MGLSDIFSKLISSKHGGKSAGGKPSANVPVKAVSRPAMKPKRNNSNAPIANNSKPGKSPQVRGNKQGRGRPASSGDKASKAQGGRGKKGHKDVKKPTSAEDLDKEMDSYWVKGGKAENITALLDKEMDDYKAAAKSSKSEATA